MTARYPHLKARFHRIGVVLILGATIGGRINTVRGQSTDAPVPTPPTSEKGDLTSSYVDRSFGFSIDYPAGSTIIREKRFVAAADTELARFVQEQHIWSLAVRLSKTARPIDAKAMLATIRDNLKSVDPDLKTTRADTSRLENRQVIRFAAILTSEDKKWFRQQAVIPDKSDTYYTLIMITPATDESVAAKTFEKILSSFRLLRSEQTQQQIDEALKRGTSLILEVASDPQKLALTKPIESFFRVVQNGTEVGFVRVYQANTDLQTHHGVGIEEISWLFQPDGSIVHSVNMMFQADTLDFSKWNNTLRIINPSPDGKPPAISLAVETGLQQNDKLLVAYSPKFNAPRMQDTVLEVEPSFGGRAWFVLLPRLLDLAKPELYAFSAYDSDRRGLCLQTLEVVGPSQVVVDGQNRSAIRLRGSEGLTPPYDETFVDEAGRLLKVTSGQVQMFATTKDYVDRTYKSRVDQNLKIFEKSPVPMPAPPQH